MSSCSRSRSSTASSPARSRRDSGSTCASASGSRAERQRFLHRVVLLLAVDRGQRIGQAHRLTALEGIWLAIGQVGARGLEVAGQAGHVDPQPIVAQQLVHHRPQLIAHLRAEAVEQRRHLRRLTMEVLDQLVDIGDAGREVAAVLRHEGVEVVGHVGARGVLLQHRVEVAHHLPDTVEVLGGDALDALLEPGEVGLEHLLTQLVGELVERVARLVVHELVVAQAADAARRRWAAARPAGSRAGERCGASPARPCAPAPDRGPGARRESAARPRVSAALDPGTLGRDDLVEASLDVTEHRVEVRSARALPGAAPGAAR